MKLVLLAVTVTSLTSAKPSESELKKPYQSLFGNVRDLIGTFAEMTLIEDTSKYNLAKQVIEAKPIESIHNAIQENVVPAWEEISQEVKEAIEAAPPSEQIESVFRDVEENIRGYLSNMNKCNRPGIEHFISHTFTNCGSTGSEGPSYEQCISEYAKPIRCHWAMNRRVGPYHRDEMTGKYFAPPMFTIIENGYQEWTVETTGTYNITASGAMGGVQYAVGFCGGIHSDHQICQGSHPDKGSTVSVEAELKKGDTYYIAVGQQGIKGIYGGGGGGGTFMVKKPSQTSVYSDVEESDVLVVAAGGDGSNCDSTYCGLCNCTGVARAMGGGIRQLKSGKQTENCKTAGGFGGGAPQVSVRTDSRVGNGLLTDLKDWWCAGAEGWASGDDEADSSLKSDGSYVKRELMLNNYTMNDRDNLGDGSISIKLMK